MWEYFILLVLMLAGCFAGGFVAGLLFVAVRNQETGEEIATPFLSGYLEEITGLGKDDGKIIKSVGLTLSSVRAKGFILKEPYEIFCYAIPRNGNRIVLQEPESAFFETLPANENSVISVPSVANHNPPRKPS